MAKVNRIDNAMSEIEKRIEYCLKKLEEKECEKEHQSSNRTEKE